LVQIFGHQLVNVKGQLAADEANWPNALKSVFYFLVAGLTAAKLTVDRGWGQLRTKADVALIVLGVVLVLAGIFGPSSPKLIAEALFVYLRGAVVLYALRALNPSRLWLRRLFLLLGGVLLLDAGLALIEMVVGPPAYRALGWTDMSWATINRAHALFNHPNDLGHFTALMLLGVVSVIATREQVSRRLWALLVVVALALAASQSRESIAGVLGGVAVIALLRWAKGRRLAVIAGIIFLTAAVPVVVSPTNRAEWSRRIAGVTDAMLVPSGAECRTGSAAGTADAPAAACSGDVPDREVRVLYMQQGVKLLLRRPALGYGVGQFGGIVAYQDDPNWALDPRFKPNGFDRYGFQAKTVDSFWLHLIVEAGVLGTAAYLAWLYFLAAPLVRVAGRRRQRARAPAHPLFYWAPAALAFVAFAAILSPALEDPLVPPILFTIVGAAWVLLARGEGTGTGLTRDSDDSDGTTGRTLAEAGRTTTMEQR
jgi:hypothetical protein